MNFQQRLQDLSIFLKPYQEIWQNEIMLLYPNPLTDYDPAWVDELASFRDKEDIIRLEKKEVSGLIKNPELLAYYQRIADLCQVDSPPPIDPLPVNQFTFLFMVPKKQHEIKNLAPLVHHLYQQVGGKRIVDIGGGIGLLAQTLSNQYQLPVTSIDRDPVMQKTGSDRNKKNTPTPDHLVQYKNLDIKPDSPDFAAALSPDSLSLGLHTCGRLALDLISSSVRSKVPGLINLGCCYHTLIASDQQNISSFSRQLSDPLRMNKFALTLSARAHRKMDEKDFNLKLKVKLYRYAMHMLLHDEYGIEKLITLGNSSPKLYDESFAVYATEQLSRVGLIPLNEHKLNNYYLDPERQRLIWKMLAAGLIRNALGRPLELYLQVDRALWLQEQGYQTRLWELFDETISPRNLALISIRGNGL